jgi:LmbE family N-acetylglucosaminyl deacetylase
MDIEKIERALVFAAHPDNEILGVGGTIARMSKQGTKITVAIFSLEDTIHSAEEMKNNVVEMRKKEARTAAGILGVQESVFLQKSPHSILHDTAVYQDCIRLIRKYRPQIIFTHCPQDERRNHRCVSEIIDEASPKAGENILADLGKPWAVPYLYYYELSSLFTQPSDIVDIGTTIESKIKAMKTQSSHLGALPELTEYIRALAKVRGHVVGIEYGEAFLLSPLTPCKH